MTKKLLIIAAMVACLLLKSAAAEENTPKLSGQIDFSGRYFGNDGLYAGQSSKGFYPTIGGYVETAFDVGAGRFALEVAGLLDEQNGRTYGSIQKLYYTQSTGDWDLLFGFNTENWGVAESQNIVNVMNPSDLSDPIAGKGLIGTPMINANYHSEVGTFSGYILAPFLEGNNFERSTRFRPPVIPNYNKPVFEEGDGRNIDFALRHVNNLSLGDAAVDYSVSYFSGTNRDPGCINVLPTGGFSSCDNAVFAALGPGGPPLGSSNSTFWKWMEANATDALVSGVSAIPFPGLRAFYEKMDQVGATGVYAYDDLQLRFETFYRWTSSGNYFSTIVGGDYTFNNLAGSEASLTVAAEYLYDDRQASLFSTVFENDIFLGLDYRLNNAYDSSASFGVFHDLDSQANLFKLGLYSRINDHVGVTVNATKVVVNGWNDPLAFVKNDDFVELQVNTFF